ncbi:hypothetical protein [Methanococcoides burtonii]|uniref:Uncharacterized protein n=1 Tax=Methanococcoides burtonii (strain DSM 6242 / NBRC 107633 / OCM 468 / ACE-M) TaxID=259564 RepID=Q12ZQ8_METBU|nr:hypothetical protein [Methanococcoides burtonii]ABE51068.1 Hypothetical protein Mbur_0046 [Methanococcoides burtonii DSM 6242]
MEASRNWYIRSCKFTVHHFSHFIKDMDSFATKAERSVSQEYRDSITFTGFVIEPFETVMFSYVGTFATLALLLLFDTLLFQITTFDRTILTLVVVLTITLPCVFFCTLVNM